jgi:hypothetical protein
VTATASNTIATMTSTMTKPFRDAEGWEFTSFEEEESLRNELFIIL